MIVEPRSSATILALAELADVSAKKLEDGHSIEDVIETLRKAALAVRKVINSDEEKGLDEKIETADNDEAEKASEECSDISA